MISSSMADSFGANDLNQRLLRERIVFLGSQVDQNTANRICAELLLLEAEDRDKDISLYIPRWVACKAKHPTSPFRQSKLSI